MDFLTRTRGRTRLSTTDILTYSYLSLGTLLMFAPVIWLVLSSFKPQAQLLRFPPALLPSRQETVIVPGYDAPLDLYTVTMNDGSTTTLAQVKRVGIEAQMIDPEHPETIIKVNINQRQPLESFSLAFDNYTRGIATFDFWTYLRNSLIVTTLSTLLTLFINSLAAFGLSKYQFYGRNALFLLMLSTLMVPLSVILIPVFLVITSVGWGNTLTGVIVPAAATPTGVFLLRQYMLSIPDEVIDSARMDGASEWRIYWQIILPLSTPALAVLTIFSVMWRWNDLLWPLIVLSRKELFTLQVGLNSFRGEFNTQWDLVLAMTVLTLLPITIVFAFLQRYITTGIATTGMK